MVGVGVVKRVAGVDAGVEAVVAVVVAVVAAVGVASVTRVAGFDLLLELPGCCADGWVVE